MGVRMGINFNKNSFGKLTASAYNNAKVQQNANKVADAKVAKSEKENSPLNTATLKSNQGIKFDSNGIFNRLGDVVPMPNDPPVQKTDSNQGQGGTNPPPQQGGGTNPPADNNPHTGNGTSGTTVASTTTKKGTTVELRAVTISTPKASGGSNTGFGLGVRISF